MRALQVHAWSAPPVVEEVPDPEPADGETLVRIEAAGIGHLDRTIWSGRFLRPPALPYTPGVEGAGTVVAGAAFPVGSRVWVRGGGVGVTRPGTWASLVAAPDAAIGALPDDVPFEVGAGFFSPCTSAWVSLHRVGHVARDETVLVTGAAGAVGSMTAQLALDAGARVIGAVSSSTRAELLHPGVEALVLDGGVTPELAVDLLIDTVGGPTLAAVLPSVVPGGRAVLVGYMAGSELVLDLPSFVQRDVSLLPLNMVRREADGRSAAPALLQRLGRGELRLPVTIFDLADALRALDWLVARDHVGRAILRPA